MGQPLRTHVERKPMQGQCASRVSEQFLCPKFHVICHELHKSGLLFFFLFTSQLQITKL